MARDESPRREAVQLRPLRLQGRQQREGQLPQEKSARVRSFIKKIRKDIE